MSARIVRSALLAAALVCAFAGTARANGSMADVDAAARAAGNRPKIARAIGDALFAKIHAAIVQKVRVDGVGAHDVAELTITGKRFHRPLDPNAFLREVDRFVEDAFSHSDVEEVDVIAIVPLPTFRHEVVAGDRAMPTSQIVFASTLRRADPPTIRALLHSNRTTYWNQAWRESLERAART